MHNKGNLMRKSKRLIKRFSDLSNYAFDNYTRIEDYFSLEKVLQLAEALQAICKVQREEIERVLNED